MSLDIIQTLKDAASAFPVDSIRRAQIELAGQRIEMLQEQVVALKEENASLKEKATDLASKLKGYEERELPKEFEEKSGYLFKRMTGGGYHNVVYCPNCRIATSRPLGGVFGYVCSRCHWSSDISEDSIASIIKTLP